MGNKRTNKVEFWNYKLNLIELKYKEKIQKIW